MSTRDLQARYERMDWRQHLGNLASTLARLSNRALQPEHDALVADLRQEAALVIEWSAAKAPQPALLQLAAMQKEILAFKGIWPHEPMRSMLALYTRNRSDLLLQLAGFTEA